MIKLTLHHKLRVDNLRKSIKWLLFIFLFSQGVLFSQTLKNDAVVTFRLINGKTGAVVDGLETVFSVSSTDSTLINNNVKDTKVKSTRSGTASFGLIRNIDYSASVSVLRNGTPVNNGIEASDGNYYVIPREAVVFTPSKDLKTFVDFVLRPSESLLDVNVVDDKGGAVQSGYVQADSEASNSSKGNLKEHVVGDRVLNGKVTLPVLAGRTYWVSFGASIPSLVSPERVQVVIGRSGRYGLKFPMKPAEHSVAVMAKVSGEIPNSDLVGFFFCYAYNKAGQYVKGVSADGGAATLLLENSVGAQWQVGCQLALDGDGDGDEDLYTGELSYKVAGGLSSSLSVPLEEVKGYFPETAYAIVGGAESTFKTPDGEATLSVPEGLFSTEDSVAVVLQTGRGYVATSASKPLVAYDIKFFKNGSQVNELGAPVVISIPVDEDKVAELGGTIDDVYPASYDEENGKWIRETNYTYDGSSSTIKIYASHFSVWGLLVDLLDTLSASAPVNLRVAVPQIASTGRRAVLLYWNKPVDGSGSEYHVEVAVRAREVLANNQSKKGRRRFRYSFDWSKAKVSSTRLLRVRAKLSKGTYQFRVKAIGGAFSEIKQFRVR
jgi:hypothetical protein